MDIRFFSVKMLQFNWGVQSRCISYYNIHSLFLLCIWIHFMKILKKTEPKMEPCGILPASVWGRMKSVMWYKIIIGTNKFCQFQFIQYTGLSGSCGSTILQSEPKWNTALSIRVLEMKLVVCRCNKWGHNFGSNKKKCSSFGQLVHTDQINWVSQECTQIACNALWLDYSNKFCVLIFLSFAVSTLLLLFQLSTDP